jgi:tetratricopeptide (TPR) repeat protein
VDATDELDLARRRYSIHPLMRAFATAKLQWEPEIGQTARRRLAEFFHAFTRKYGGFWVAGFTLLESDVPNVLAIIQWCWDQQMLVNVAMDIFHDVAYFMISRGYWNDTMDFGQRAVTVATDLGDELNAARFKVWPVSWIYRHRGDLDQAERHITEALGVLCRLDEKEGIAAAKHSLGRLAQERGQLQQAERLLEEAFAYYESIEDELQIYFLTANLANLALQQGNLEKAWELSISAEEAARQLGDPEIVASLLNTMGGVARQRGDLQQAKAFLEEALTLRKQVNRLDEIADTLLSLARVLIEMNMKQTAKQMLSDALETYQKLEMLKARTQEVGSLLAQLSESTDQTEQKRHQTNGK